jgi:NAD/NADP transhydrogenase alpha subunit
MRVICNVANAVVVVCALLALLRATDGYLTAAGADPGALPASARLDPTLVLILAVALAALAAFNYALLALVSRPERSANPNA